jgi:hypothetical protein
MQMETFLEKTDRMLKAIVADPANSDQTPARELNSLWRSGLSSSLLYRVGEPDVNASVEKEAKIIVSRHLGREQENAMPISTSGLMDFQNQLHMRSKVICAIEMLLRG